MKPLMLSLLLFTAMAASEARAQVDVQYQPEMEILVLMLKESIPQDNALPMVKVRMGKILLRNGGFVKELPVKLQDSKLLPQLMKEHFRLYRGPKQFGIYKYVSVPNGQKPKKSDDYISAIPIDRDATVQAITAETKEQADILNLLNMSVDEASAAVQNETKLNESLARAEAAEIGLLKNGKLDKTPLFFVPVKAK
ncbi:MAG: hypothetical protein JXA73_10695 [Acidobacteria bacterium]|nr:hypothetical protein [Acidobacteriota bacterium]